MESPGSGNTSTTGGVNSQTSNLNWRHGPGCAVRIVRFEVGRIVLDTSPVISETKIMAEWMRDTPHIMCWCLCSSIVKVFEIGYCKHIVKCMVYSTFSEKWLALVIELCCKKQPLGIDVCTVKDANSISTFSCNVQLLERTPVVGQ